MGCDVSYIRNGDKKIEYEEMKVKLIKKVLYIVCIVCFLGSGAKIVSYYIESAISLKGYHDLKCTKIEIIGQRMQKQAKIGQDEETDVSDEDSNYRMEDKAYQLGSKLMEINSDFMGWLSIDNTNIEYPIVQTDNNDYYLNHDFWKNRSGIGTLFVDYRVEPTMKDIVIYGHNLKNQKMFSELIKYKNEKFMKEHREVKLHLGGEMRRYQIASIYSIDAMSENAEAFNSFMELQTMQSKEVFLAKMQEDALINLTEGIESKKEWLILCTCDNEKNKRLLLLAQRKS